VRRAIRGVRPGTTVETLISDAKGSRDALGLLFDVRPDVLNHNLETVARLQRAVRPSAGYSRSLSVLAHAKAAGLVTKSGIMVGLGETDDEIVGALADLAGVGCDIVTISQYLRPTTHHLPLARRRPPSSSGSRSPNSSASAREFSPVTAQLSRQGYRGRRGVGAVAISAPVTAVAFAPVTTQLAEADDGARGPGDSRATDGLHRDGQQHGSRLSTSASRTAAATSPADVHCQCLFPQRPITRIFRTDGDIWCLTSNVHSV
jgi:hypothetical protein